MKETIKYSTKEKVIGLSVFFTMFILRAVRLATVTAALCFMFVPVFYELRIMDILIWPFALGLFTFYKMSKEWEQVFYA